MLNDIADSLIFPPISRMQILLGYLVLVAQIKQEINDKVKHTLRKETISEAEIETFNFLFDDYLDITIPPAPNDAGLDATKTQDLKTETRHILQICQLEEEVCSTIKDTIKRYKTTPVPRALQQELFTSLTPRAEVTANFTGQLGPLQCRIPLSTNEAMSWVPATGQTSPISIPPSGKLLNSF